MSYEVIPKKELQWRLHVSSKLNKLPKPIILRSSGQPAHLPREPNTPKIKEYSLNQKFQQQNCATTALWSERVVVHR